MQALKNSEILGKENTLSLSCNNNNNNREETLVKKVKKIKDKNKYKLKIPTPRIRRAALLRAMTAPISPRARIEETSLHIVRRRKKCGSDPQREIFYCSDCNFKSYYKGNLKTHQLIHLRMDSFKEPKTLQKKNLIYRCSECSFSTSKRLPFKYHVLSHSNESLYPFKCSSCNFRTKYKNNWKQHQVKIHNRNYTEVANVKFKKNSSLSHKRKNWKGLKKAKISSFQEKAFKIGTGNTEKMQRTCTFKEKKSLNMMKKGAFKNGINSRQNLSIKFDNLVDKNCFMQQSNSKDLSSRTVQKIGPAALQRSLTLSYHRKSQKKGETPLSLTDATFYKCAFCNFQTKYKANLRTHHLRFHDVTRGKVKRSQNKTKSSIQKKDSSQTNKPSRKKIDLQTESKKLSQTQIINKPHILGKELHKSPKDLKGDTTIKASNAERKINKFESLESETKQFKEKIKEMSASNKPISNSNKKNDIEYAESGLNSQKFEGINSNKDNPRDFIKQDLASQNNLNNFENDLNYSDLKVDYSTIVKNKVGNLEEDNLSKFNVSSSVSSKQKEFDEANCNGITHLEKSNNYSTGVNHLNERKEQTNEANFKKNTSPEKEVNKDKFNRKPSSDEEKSVANSSKETKNQTTKDEDEDEVMIEKECLRKVYIKGVWVEKDPLMIPGEPLEMEKDLIDNSTTLSQDKQKENTTQGAVIKKEQFLIARDPLSIETPLKTKSDPSHSCSKVKRVVERDPLMGNTSLMEDDIEIVEEDPLMIKNSLMDENPLNIGEQQFIEDNLLKECKLLMKDGFDVENTDLKPNSEGTTKILKETSLLKNKTEKLVKSFSKEMVLKIPKVSIKDYFSKKKYTFSTLNNYVPKIHMNPIVLVERLKENSLKTNNIVCPQIEREQNSEKGMSNYKRRKIDMQNTKENKEKRVYSKKPYKCSKCNFKTELKKDLKEHLYVHSKVGRWQCSHCAYSTDIKASMKQHERTHRKTKILTCSWPTCNYATNFKENLEMHQLNHTRIRRYKCSQCNFSSNLRNTLKLHQNSHIESSKFECFYCNFKSDKKCLLRRHIFMHQEIEENVLKTKTKKYECFKCGLIYNSQTGLRQHSMTHLDFNIYHCSLCDFATNHKGSLVKHVLSHEQNTGRD